ncbi:5-formyltetrahydrofolate cyclo-ligase [Alteromonas sp. 5E99-2]|uniref:5-formyltetrahydrofolate cyclo-ligase n=1 Tax=Alteromonas sp. 5E99-2 TaxID=2817683 RepID=UPI001A99E435|nr:5-formyltetrahydrofolate cyclo-ligase [Alteromonas sp. 5E99-2]
MTLNKPELRKQFRTNRQTLSELEQNNASRLLNSKIQQYCSSLSSQPKVIAAYLANDGEPSLTPFIHWGWENEMHLALPVIHPFTKGCIFFQRYQSSTIMHYNKFGIEEPKLNCHSLVPFHNIDIILMPLVAFDDNKNRLGMGGGFYDKSLALTWKRKHRPKLVGIAHTNQYCDQRLPCESWDIPLDNIITPDYLI